jgi:hypothetical protein
MGIYHLAIMGCDLFGKKAAVKPSQNNLNITEQITDEGSR